MKKRCVFCHKVLDEKGRCQNKACPDYIRTQILEEAEKEAANADSATADGTSHGKSVKPCAMAVGVAVTDAG